MLKTEAEFEFYGCTLEELKKECKSQFTIFPNILTHNKSPLTHFLLCVFSDERMFRLHTKRMVEKFTNNVIDAAQRELTVETANKIQSLTDDSLNLVKPETIKILSKFNALIDKNFTIPTNVSMGENSLQNTPAMDDYEKECKKEIAELERVYKQQAIMMSHLMAELELYDNSQLVEEAEIDMGICELFENNFTDSNFSAEIVDNVVRQLNSIGIHSKSPSK